MPVEQGVCTTDGPATCNLCLRIETCTNIEYFLSTQVGTYKERKLVALLVPEHVVEVTAGRPGLGGNIDGIARHIGLGRYRAVDKWLVEVHAVVKFAQLPLGVKAKLTGKLVSCLNVVPVEDRRVHRHEIQGAVTGEPRYPVPVMKPHTYR